MQNKNDFSHLNFNRPPAGMHPRLMVFLIACGVYVLLWWLLPPSALLTLLFFVVPILTWVASYGWREALQQIIRYLERLQMN